MTQLLRKSKSIDRIRNTEVATVLYAIANVGPPHINIDQISEILVIHKDIQVRVAMIRLLERFGSNSSVALNHLRWIALNDNSTDIRNMAWTSLQKHFDPDQFDVFESVPPESSSLFPNNRSYGGEIDIGGSDINTKFGVNMFLGTLNTDKQTKYKTMVNIWDNANIFSVDTSLFSAKAFYEQHDQFVLLNHMSLSILGSTVFNGPIYQKICNHIHRPYHRAPDLSVKKTVMIVSLKIY
eukprot:gb/GECH01003676.1/.p1 GENE.gb/GECH01003676.1/~~gb/GECH01003676.1/.p1  ORF type:complete len:239 (+),score=36.12 gb/GECH01003676.1/:1-717(+)